MLKSFNFLTTETTKNICAIKSCQDTTKMMLTRMIRTWTQYEEHRNKNTFLIFESQK